MESNLAYLAWRKKNRHRTENTHSFFGMIVTGVVRD